MGAWIETKSLREGRDVKVVAPYMGAWIETLIGTLVGSLAGVAPYMGAWIETGRRCSEYPSMEVAPYMGAWIETGSVLGWVSSSVPSLPIWERGLKQKWTGSWWCRRPVAPYMGAWIETQPNLHTSGQLCRRSLYGSVD